MTEKHTHFSAGSCDLKPCPFCGAQEAFVTVVDQKSDPRTFYRVRCDNCEAASFGCYCLDREGAMKEWNTRSLTPAPAQAAVVPDPFNRKQVEAVCRAVCNVEGLDPDDAEWTGGDPPWTRYADAVASALASQPSPAATVNKKTRCESCNLLEPCADPQCPNSLTRSSAATGDAWPPLKMALWRVLMAENLNDGHYIKAFDLIEKLHAAAAPCVDSDLADLRCLVATYAKEANEAKAALTRDEPQAVPVTPAYNLISQIEARFPNWTSYRDLLDCIDCTLHQLRAEVR